MERFLNPQHKISKVRKNLNSIIMVENGGRDHVLVVASARPSNTQTFPVLTGGLEILLEKYLLTQGHPEVSLGVAKVDADISPALHAISEVEEDPLLLGGFDHQVEAKVADGEEGKSVVCHQIFGLLIELGLRENIGLGEWWEIWVCIARSCDL
ncbi:hypothetical protein AMTR_s00105p00100810 [Amborella trichopoda]|uniref:Uncharacterized protein n=1 Tax=Amborella trichopoda TaxID=13333 RepID=W1NXJ4_AMBTC|nr:hypothetical protein AMTR_s00105p00100810 [Amborella trichopoda]